MNLIHFRLTQGTGLQCYYCLHYDKCTADEPGELVECQMENPSEPHYGDACEVAHTGKNLINHEVCQETTVSTIYIFYKIAHHFLTLIL